LDPIQADLVDEIQRFSIMIPIMIPIMILILTVSIRGRSSLILGEAVRCYERCYKKDFGRLFQAISLYRNVNAAVVLACGILYANTHVNSKRDVCIVRPFVIGSALSLPFLFQLYIQS